MHFNITKIVGLLEIPLYFFRIYILFILNINLPDEYLIKLLYHLIISTNDISSVNCFLENIYISSSRNSSLYSFSITGFIIENWLSINIFGTTALCLKLGPKMGLNVPTPLLKEIEIFMHLDKKIRLLLVCYLFKW